MEHEDGYFSEPFPDRKERTEAEKEETEKDEKGNHTKIALTHAMLDGLINGKYVKNNFIDLLLLK